MSTFREDDEILDDLFLDVELATNSVSFAW